MPEDWLSATAIRRRMEGKPVPRRERRRAKARERVRRGAAHNGGNGETASHGKVGAHPLTWDGEGNGISCLEADHAVLRRGNKSVSAVRIVIGAVAPVRAITAACSVANEKPPSVISRQAASRGLPTSRFAASNAPRSSAPEAETP